MTSLLHGAALLGHLGFIFQDPVMPPPPSEVRFDSVDYKTILCWTPPTNSTSLSFYVQRKIYGESQWFDVHSCWGIQRLHCDLSHVMSDSNEWYYARVHASSSPSSKSAWARSHRFSPRWGTRISPPVLKLAVTDQEIVVHVKPPKPRVQKMHSSLVYKIYLVHSSGEEEVFAMDCCFNKLTLKDLNHKAKYCLQGQILIPLQAKTSPRGSVQCVSLL